MVLKFRLSAALRLMIDVIDNSDDCSSKCFRFFISILRTQDLFLIHSYGCQPYMKPRLTALRRIKSPQIHLLNIFYHIFFHPLPSKSFTRHRNLKKNSKDDNSTMLPFFHAMQIL